MGGRSRKNEMSTEVNTAPALIEPGVPRSIMSRYQFTNLFREDLAEHGRREHGIAYKPSLAAMRTRRGRQRAEPVRGGTGGRKVRWREEEEEDDGRAWYGVPGDYFLDLVIGAWGFRFLELLVTSQTSPQNKPNSSDDHYR